MAENLMLKTFENITRVRRDGDNATHIVKGFTFKLKEDAANDYYKEQLPTIPAGTLLLADFACDTGLYAMCEVDGALHKVKVMLHELHKIDFGAFDARNETVAE